MSAPRTSRSRRDSSPVSPARRQVLSSQIVSAQPVESAVPLNGTIEGFFPRPALPPPLPPVQRGSAAPPTGAMAPPNTVSAPSGAVRESSGSRRAASTGPPPSPSRRGAKSNDASGLLPSLHNSRARSATPETSAMNRSTAQPDAGGTPNAGAARRRLSLNPGSRPVSRRGSSSSRALSDSVDNASSMTHGSKHLVAVEELIEIPLTRTQPMEKFFLEYNPAEAEHDADGQPRNDNEVLLEQFAEYTDDDSFFSSGDAVIECDPHRLRKDPLRQRAVISVHNTLQLRTLTNGRMPEDMYWDDEARTAWIYQIHNRAIALQYSSFFIFPARWTPRVVVYNIMHHWMMEMFVFLMILGYAIFQASWGRYTADRGEMKKPDFVLWADVFYTCLLGFEVILRLFASGFIGHKRAYFRSPWAWLDAAVLVLMILECTWWQYLWNFTAWRLIRTIKCFTHVPAPVRMKLLAKSLLRATNRLIYVTLILLYFIFFFGLLGLQLFSGSLRNRCVSTITGAATTQLCRTASTGQYWFYWGHHCGELYSCVADAFPNPHYDFRSFDDIGHAMLSVFQIMTFQGWSGLLQETNDGMAVLAFLYYLFTILICTWIVPSLYLGVFLEKMEKTSRLFVLKQLDFFEHMLTEQRQRMSTMVRLNDYVERDETGQVSHYPAYTRQKESEKEAKLMDDDTFSGSSAEKTHRAKSKGKHRRDIQATRWTDEQRLQLQLALTRQRSVAEEAERRRLLQNAALGDLIVDDGQGKRRGSHARRSTRRGSAAARASAPVMTRDDFALGGRVGAVQHHPAAYAIGASHQSTLPFAVRQEVQAEQLRFLDPYTNNASTAKNDVYNSATKLRQGATSPGAAGGGAGANAMDDGQTVHSRGTSAARPPLSASNRSQSVWMARETAGVVPHRRTGSQRGVMSRTSSMSELASVSRLHASMTHGAMATVPRGAMPAGPTWEEVEIVINDPEGGDFDEARTCTAKVNIIRNILHMFTEGYPRIVTQYLWEHRMMRYHYGLAPLSYTNKYEGEALRRLRQRRAMERREERAELRRNGLGHLIDEEDEDEDETEMDLASMDAERPWMRREGLVAGGMSPIRMARNIRENAPISVFNYLVYFFILANAVFNASRFDTMPDYWEMGVFVAGVCFSVLFMLELLIRLIALGPGPFFTDPMILIETTFMVISLFQLGFSRANTTAVFNWVRFLRLFRVVPVRPLRRVTRVLLHGFADMVYALIFFTMYMFMWLLLGMSFFGSRIGWLDGTVSDYETRGNFETFSHAAYAIAQAFSVNRDEWLYMSWSGMRVRGGYTIMYFMATVGIAFIFRFFFIAVMTYAWQAQQEREDEAFMSGSSHQGKPRRSRFARLPFFDFSVWRSFKHIHGGFERRDVAPDEVYYLNEDMARQMRLVEAKERYYRANYERENQDWDGAAENGGYHDETIQDVVHDVQYVNIGGRLYRQPSMPASDMGYAEGVQPQHRGQLQFARRYHAVPATTFANRQIEPPSPAAETADGDRDVSHAASHTSRRSIVNPLLASRHSLSPGRQRSARSPARSSRAGEEYAADGAIVLAPRLNRLGYATEMVEDGANVETVAAVDESSFEHLLLPGPRLRYKSYVEEGRRAFETCLDCNTHLQMPLRAPLGVAQRTPDELHAEHCHVAAVRSSQQLVLSALLGYARMQADHEMAPTKRMIEVVLGQAWSCGMLLFETIENLSCIDVPERERTWDRVLEALELQQWLLGLHVGEEQVGRATLAYILAHQKKQEEVVGLTGQYTTSWTEYSLFVLSPTNPLRRGITAMVNSMAFECISLIVIYAAAICLALYCPSEGNRDFGGSYNNTKYKVLHILDDVFSVIFAVELLLKWLSMGVVLPVGRAYFWHLWNIFDCFIVIISLVSWGLPYVFLRYLKVMRCFRILGPLRYWRWGSSSMSLVARTIWDSIPTLANVCLLMLMNYIVWAILFVSMFMNKLNTCTDSSIVNGTQCVEQGFKWNPAQRNFRNFYESLLTTFEISTGAEWLDVMYSAVDSRSTMLPPLANRHPYLGLVFIAYYYVSHFVLFTLFMSALIYCYMLAKSATEDAAGTTVEHQVWLRMQGMLLRLRPNVRLAPMNNALSRFLHRLLANVWFEAFMGLILTFNMVTMALQWHHMNNTQRVTLDVFQYVFIGFFTLEVILRLLAHGPRFFTRWAYCLDLLICVLSYLQIGLNTTSAHRIPFNVNVLRVLRIGRIVQMLNLGLPFSTHFALFHEVLTSSVPGLISVTFIYMLSVFVFAVLGLHFLGYMTPYSGNYVDNTYNNFATFVNALIMVFRLSTLQNWATMLRASMDNGNYCGRADGRCGPTNWAPVYYIPIVICFFLLMSTLYLAVVLDKYVAVVRMRSAVTRLEDLRRFCDLWSRRDPNATMWLPSASLPALLEELRLPLGLGDRHNRLEVLQLLREYNIPDHNGMVHYYEVLLPLARRVMAMAFNEAADASSMGGQAPSEIAWRLSEHSLGAMPSTMTKIRPSTVTVAEQYAAALVQAAYRRDRARRAYFIAKSARWRQGRRVCVTQGVSYIPYGFGRTSLAGPDPREEGLACGFDIPADATLSGAGTDAPGKLYADPAATRIAAARAATASTAGGAAGDGAATLLPALYRTAITGEERRFGPDAPGAIRRHERRDAKLSRRRAQEAAHRAHHVDIEGDGSSTATAEGYDLDDERSLDDGYDESFDSESPYREATLESQSPLRQGAYNLDRMDANYQPPLGTSPEALRQEEVVRRRSAAGLSNGGTPTYSPRE